MMNNPRLLRIILLSAAVLLSIPQAAHAEVCGDSQSSLVLGITQDPDPVPMITWEPIDVDRGGEPLNPDGDDRNDGRPDVAYHPQTGHPLVVWAYKVGVDHDIAFSEWNGLAWEPVRFLTFEVTNDVDPRIFVDLDGTVYVVWWVTDEPNTVYLSRRLAGSNLWDAPVLIATDARRPTVAVAGNQVLVAYERDAPEASGQEVVVQVREDGAVIAEVIVAATDRSEPLDIVLHALHGTVWIDWKDADALFGYALYENEGFSVPVVDVPWPDQTWIGVEDVRRTIRRVVFAN